MGIVVSAAVRCWICLAVFAGQMGVARGSSQAAAPTPLVIGLTDDGTIATKLVEVVYAEAFRRLAIPTELRYYPILRRSVMLDKGLIDLDGGRVFGYGQDHPKAVRVEESIFSMHFYLYTARHGLQIQNIEELKGTKLLVDYRRGVGLCENQLKRLLPPEQISDLASDEQGLGKLRAGRTDLYCSIDHFIRPLLAGQELKGGGNIRPAVSLGGGQHLYPYLHERHAKLAPRLAAVLKEMKKEGLVDRYRSELGMAP